MSLSQQELQRYSRHLLMPESGEEAQLQLKAARVLVVGAGGLGCPCLLYLTAAGVGLLGIADDDVVSLSNLQRQVLYNADDMGKSKAEAARTHLLQKNPLVEIRTHPAVTRDNVLSLLPLYDLVIDGSDNFATRYLLNDACVITGKPYIYGALFRFEGQVSTFNYKNGPTYRCLYPEMPEAGSVPACGEAGVLGVLPGIIGTWQATEAIKVITGIGEVLSGKLLTVNLFSNEMSILGFRANEENKAVKELKDYEEVCVSEPRSVEYVTLSRWIETEDLQIIDVREEDEFERYNIGGLNLPFSVLSDELDKIRTGRKTVLVCQTGARSLKALDLLRREMPELDVYNLAGGLQTTL